MKLSATQHDYLAIARKKKKWLRTKNSHVEFSLIFLFLFDPVSRNESKSIKTRDYKEILIRSVEQKQNPEL